jgi:hypothetical protein
MTQQLLNPDKHIVPSSSTSTFETSIWSMPVSSTRSSPLRTIDIDRSPLSPRRSERRPVSFDEMPGETAALSYETPSASRGPVPSLDHGVQDADLRLHPASPRA